MVKVPSATRSSDLFGVVEKAPFFRDLRRFYSRSTRRVLLTFG
jgi:hypothetical protein